MFIRLASQYFNITAKLSLLLLASLLGACGPVMKTVTDYHPPVTDSGMRCIANANHDRTSCDKTNLVTLDKCEMQASIDAEYAYEHAMKNYTHDLELYISKNEQYEHDYEHYEEQKQLVISNGELEYVKCSKDVDMVKTKDFPQCLKLLNRAKKKARQMYAPREPSKPYKPAKHDIVAKLKQECRAKLVNCERRFDQAYRSCGGSISTREVCIERCD